MCAALYPENICMYGRNHNEADPATKKKIIIKDSITNEPMDIDAIQTSKARGPLSAEEKGRRKSLNLCMYCGDADHLLENCTALKKTRFHAIKAVTFQEAVEVMGSISEVDSDEASCNSKIRRQFRTLSKRRRSSNNMPNFLQKLDQY